MLSVKLSTFSISVCFMIFYYFIIINISSAQSSSIFIFARSSYICFLFYPVFFQSPPKMQALFTNSHPTSLTSPKPTSQPSPNHPQKQKLTPKQKTANNNNKPKQKMQSNLMKIHELIGNIQRNINNYKKVRQNCSELEQYIEYIQPTTKYHYMLFLVEIYAAKLRDFQSAENLCRKIVHDRRLSVQLEGTLRMNFIHALQREYSQAIKSLQEAEILSENKPELELIILNYFQRMLLYSKQSNLLNGGKCQQLQKYQEAIQYYNQEFQTQVVEKQQIQNKYYAAKAILRLINSFPAKKFNGLDGTKYKNYLSELAEEKEEKDNTAQMDQIDKNYQNQRAYHKKIADLFLKKQASLKKSRSFSKNSSTLFNIQLENKRFLAILKLQKVLKCEKKLNPIISAEFEKCLKELQQNQINNYTMLHEFTLNQYKIANRGTQLLKKMLKKPIFTYLKTKYISQFQDENHKIKPKRPSLFQNQTKNENQSPTRFTKHPIQDQIQSNFNMKIKPTNSVQDQEQQSEVPSNFTGSYMQKINDTSDGHELRYFYFKQTEFVKGKMKLYYNSKESKIDDDDSFYDLKRFRGLLQGKTTKAFKRSECDKFQQERCFSIMLEDKVYRNFYVPDKKDYLKWIAVFKKYINIKGMASTPIKISADKSKHQQKMRKTVMF